MSPLVFPSRRGVLMIVIQLTRNYFLAAYLSLVRVVPHAEFALRQLIFLIGVKLVYQYQHQNSTDLLKLAVFSIHLTS